MRCSNTSCSQCQRKAGSYWQMHSHSCFLNYLRKTQLFGIASKCHETAVTNTWYEQQLESMLLGVWLVKLCQKYLLFTELPEVAPHARCLKLMFPLGIISISSSICAIQRVDEKLPDGSRKSLKSRLLSCHFKEAALPVEISDFCQYWVLWILGTTRAVWRHDVFLCGFRFWHGYHWAPIILAMVGILFP